MSAIPSHNKDPAFDFYCDLRCEALNTAHLLPSAKFDSYVRRNFLDLYDLGEFKRVSRLYNNYHAKKLRLFKKISKWCRFGACYFLTLTFSDDTLSSTSALSRRRYVSRFLGSLDSYYIANVDFGDEKEREHFHAFIILKDSAKYYETKIIRNRLHVKSEIFDYWNRYGFYSACPVLPQEEDRVRLSKYIAKLSNHALKQSTDQKLIYCRKLPEWLKENHRYELMLVRSGVTFEKELL